MLHSTGPKDVIGPESKYNHPPRATPTTTSALRAIFDQLIPRAAGVLCPSILGTVTSDLFPQFVQKRSLSVIKVPQVVQKRGIVVLLQSKCMYSTLTLFSQSRDNTNYRGHDCRTVKAFVTATERNVSKGIS